MVDGLAIVGPTASGKTALAIEVAQTIGGEIISLDSRQVYAGMDIGTAKPSRTQRTAVPHFGIDVLAPNERYSAGRFSTDARAWMADIRARGKVAILSGGTGFFLRALTHPMFAEPELESSRREAMKRFLDRFSRAELLRWLDSLDGVAAVRLASEGGRHRVARAVEVPLLTGRTLSEWHHAHPATEPPLRFLTVLLDVERAELYQRINRRVDEMVSAGLVSEVQQLLDAGYDESAPGLKTVGYTEILEHLRGRLSLDDAIEDIRRATRRYARRQETWFRHQLPADTITLDATQPLLELVEKVRSAWQSLKSA